MALSQPWAFSGQAIDAVGDPHLAPGMHYRVLANPLLGLPVVPMLIRKVRLGQMAKGYTRRDVIWTDRHGAVTTPFTVTPDNPVTGHLPVDQVCCWAAVEVRQASSGLPAPPVLGRPPIMGRPRTSLPQVVPTWRRGPRPAPGEAVTQPPHLTAPFWVEGVVNTAYGDAPVAVRSHAPFHVYASHIERIVIHGSGTVTGLSWLPAAAIEEAAPFRLAPLPTNSGKRYVGPADGKDVGFTRVTRGAPQRFGMHESPLVTDPGGCSLVDATEEVGRVEELTFDAAATLDRLINDTSAPQRLLTATEAVVDDNGVTLGKSDRFILMDLLMGAVDPGVARWLGFLDVDADMADKEVVVAYVVDALFAPDWKAILGTLWPFLPQGSIGQSGVDALLGMAELDPALEEFVDGVKRMGPGPFIVQRIVLAATVDVPLDRPAAPGLSVPLSGDWLPLEAPSAARELTIGMESLVPGAGLASAIAQPDDAKPLERNDEDGRGRRVLLTPQPGKAATTATSGVLAERRVDERDGRWQIAQLDWFGRWSSWGVQTFGPGSRPPPPRPVFTLTTRPPEIPIPVPTGPLSGLVRIEVSVPPVASLPSGGRLLHHLTLNVAASGAASTTTTHAVETPAAPQEVMVIEVPGPALLPTASGKVTITARWTDSASVDSDPSEPKSSTMHDPRPPTPVVIPPTLTFTARPDATGRARTTLQWTPSPGQASFRIFVADETTLRAKLEDTVAGVVAAGDQGQAPTGQQAQTLLSELDAAADEPARGAIWDAHRALLPRRWWLQLTAEPLRAQSSGKATFTHDVSGSLTVLVLYRVVAVSETSIESDFRTSPLLPRRVPNLLVPPAPSIEVLPTVDGSGNLRAQLTVTVPLGPTPAARYRLRRATGTSEAGLMQIVAEGAAGSRPAGDPAPQVFAVIDTGSSPSGPRISMSPWIRYIWRVEVQGAAAPGGGPVSEWSTPSDPVSTVTMPPEPPVPATDLSVTRDTEAVHVQFRHPDPLAGGATAGYTIDVYRQLAGDSLRLLTSILGQAPPPLGRGTDVDGFFDVEDNDPHAVAGTLYRVVVTDPIGRSSSPTTAQEAP